MPNSNRRGGFARGSPAGMAGTCAQYLDVSDTIEDQGRTTTDHKTMVAVN